MNKAFQGEIYIFSGALLWSLFPIFSILAIANVPPLYTAGISTLLAAVFFAIVLTIKKEWKEITVRSAWKDLLMVTVIIGIIFYSLIFIGLERTTAGNASIITLMEVFFSMFILKIWGKEKLKAKHVLGSLLMVIGALLVLFQGKLQANEGDIIILIAAAMPPIGNYFAQEARKKIGSNMIMFVRSSLAGIFILILAALFEQIPASKGFTSSILLLLINGFLLMGISKVFWIEGIHRISITKATALHSITPAFTLIFAYFTLQEMPTIWQILGFLPIAIGTLILTEYRFNHAPHPSTAPRGM